MPTRRQGTANQIGLFANPNIDELIPPIVLERAPTVNDEGDIGQLWVNPLTNSWWVLTSVGASGSSWVASTNASSTFPDVTITGGAGTVLTVQAGDVDVQAGDLTVSGALTGGTLAAGNSTITGTLDVGGVLTASANVVINADLTVTGNATITGDFDITDTASISLTSTNNAAGAISLTANGGAAETIAITSSQGTGANSINISSTVGGITLTSNLATADGINLNAVGGGIDMDSALLTSITSSRNNAQAILVEATAGGIDILASGAAAGEDIDIAATGSSINISSSEAVADAITLHASDAAGGISIRAGTGGILIGTDADTTPISVGDIAPTASRTITIGGGTVVTAAVTDLIDIAPDGATTNANSIKQVDINAGGVTLGQVLTNIATGAVTSGTHTTAIASGNRAAGTMALNLMTGTGTKTANLGNADGLTTFNIDAITLINDSINVNTSINTGTSTGQVIVGNAAAGAITLDSGAGISLDGAAASNFSVSGAGIDLTLASAAGSIIVNGGEAAADALRLVSAAGGLDTNVALQMNLDSSQAAADAIRIIASNAAGGLDLDCGTGGATLDSTGAISLDSQAASNFTVTGAFDLTVSSSAGSVVVQGGEAVADAVQLTASNAAGGVTVATGTGGLTVNSTNGAIALNSGTAGINIGTDAAAHTVTIGNGTGATSVVLNSGTGAINVGTNAVAHTVTVGSTTGASATVLQAGTGELQLSASGQVSMVPATATAASPTASVTINARVFKATFQGFTTAAAGTQAFTITNSLLQAGDGVILTVANRGSNDAQMSLRRVNTETAGSIVVNTINNGAAALNGDVVITGWIID